MRRNSVNGPAPSIRAASRTSSEIPCSPASRISIMKGAHCQTAIEMMAVFGCTASQSTRLKPSDVFTQFTRQKNLLSFTTLRSAELLLQPADPLGERLDL